MKHKDEILVALSSSAYPMQKKEITKRAGIPKNVTGPYLRNLTKEGTVRKVSYGEYVLTEAGVKKAEEIKKIYKLDYSNVGSSDPGVKQMAKPPTKTTEQKTDKVEILKLVLSFRESMGKEKTLMMLDDIRRFIEE